MNSNLFSNNIFLAVLLYTCARYKFNIHKGKYIVLSWSILGFWAFIIRIYI